jgi:hypothetical protein
MSAGKILALMRSRRRQNDFLSHGMTSTTGAESFLSTSNPSRSEAQPSDSHFTVNGFRPDAGRAISVLPHETAHG